MRSGPAGGSGRSVGVGGRAGFRVLVPGYPQWAWKQRERALVFFGLCAAALGTAAFAWGTKLGVLMLAVAFGAHVASAADAVRQVAFPGFGRPVPWTCATAGLGLGVYAPILALGTVLAWPGEGADAPGEVYLINRWAFAAHRPGVGDWVWYRPDDGRGTHVGRVVGLPGERVEWTHRGLDVAGRRLDWAPSQSDGPPIDLKFTVPPDRLLVAPLGDPPAGFQSSGLVTVPLDCIGGRAWARVYPVWRRRVLD